MEWISGKGKQNDAVWKNPTNCFRAWKEAWKERNSPILEAWWPGKAWKSQTARQFLKPGKRSEKGFKSPMLRAWKGSGKSPKSHFGLERRQLNFGGLECCRFGKTSTALPILQWYATVPGTRVLDAPRRHFCEKTDLPPGRYGEKGLGVESKQSRQEAVELHSKTPARQP